MGALTGMKVCAAAGSGVRWMSWSRHAKPDVIFHTAVSKFKDAFAQIEPMARRGISVVSSCEELLFPRLREPKLAAKLDRVCRKRARA